MESEEESRRLVAQAEAHPVLEHLVATGLSEGQVALDAGCGPGVITSVMASRVGPSGKVVGLDVSAERLAEARSFCAPLPQCGFVQADLRSSGLPDACFDYVWCQFVLEYLPRPELALAELVRMTRPGGRVVVSDVDGVGMLNWPMSPVVQEGIPKFLKALGSTGFDIHVGRKMYHLFRQAGLQDVRVRLSPLWVVAGVADSRLVQDWSIRLQTLESVAAPAFGGMDAYRAFSRAYLDLLCDEDALKYSVLLVTEGRKP
jgi:ubiquinone/menaquinone biosynthesis C-methylase UbiE